MSAAQKLMLIFESKEKPSWRAYATCVARIHSRLPISNYAAHFRFEFLQVGPVTILINNAGIMPCKPLEKQTEKDIRLNFEVNIISHFWVSSEQPDLSSLDLLNFLNLYLNRCWRLSCPTCAPSAEVTSLPCPRWPACAVCPTWCRTAEPNSPSGEPWRPCARSSDRTPRSPTSTSPPSTPSSWAPASSTSPESGKKM